MDRADEEGARVLVCSEIGSEGRNFQFAHHLVLFDLPSDPELLEQRIGRLDRIGQTGTVHIHVPHMVGTTEDVLAQWYHRGLDAFEEPLHGASEIARAVRDELDAAMDEYDERRVHQLIDSSRQERERITGKLARGYDRLLELNSNRQGSAADVIAEIQSVDAEFGFERFVIRLLEYFGVIVDEFRERTYTLKPGHLLTDEFPPLPDDGMAVTFDRERALARDDLAFFTPDHPWVRDVLELFLESGVGNSSVATWRDAGSDGVLLEMLAVVETVAPRELNVEGYLPPHPVRVVVDHQLRDCTDNAALLDAELHGAGPTALIDQEEATEELLPPLIDAAMERAEDAMSARVTTATAAMNEPLQLEIERLEDLREINPNVMPGEIDALKIRQRELRDAIGAARVRVVSMRVIFRRE